MQTLHPVPGWTALRFFLNRVKTFLPTASTTWHEADFNHKWPALLLQLLPDRVTVSQRLLTAPNRRRCADADDQAPGGLPLGRTCR